MKSSHTLHKNKLFICLLIFILSSSFPFAVHSEMNETTDHITIIQTQHFSTPQITISAENIHLDIAEANGYTNIPGNPQIPICSKVLEFPIGTIIEDISVIPENLTTHRISKELEPVPSYQCISSNLNLGTSIRNEDLYQSSTPYPTQWYSLTQGVGLNKENVRTLFVSIHLYPLRYTPTKDMITQAQSLTLQMNIRKPIQIDDQTESGYDLIIITPTSLQNTLTPLIDHKLLYGIKPYVKTLESIYTEYTGRDNPEKIKYFVKDAIETWNAKYLLLIGDMKLLPIRNTDAYPWEGYHGTGLLSDLYYADIYDSQLAFSSWDTNNDGVFGEIQYPDHQSFPPDSDQIIDEADLYADIHVGRIPCSTSSELSTVISKIITYETYTYDQLWFQKIILAGGDTFCLADGSPLFQYEGEITNRKVAQQLPAFEKEYLWSSEHNLNARVFNKAINNGAGFLSYAGHGFEHGWGTYRPNEIIGKRLIIYYTPFVDHLKNDFKLPVIFFDACLTTKLDFNITDLIQYYGPLARIYNTLFGQYTTDINFPCFAWYFLRLETGGAIATIGATRPAYTWVDKDGVYAGAGYLDVHFFKAYTEGITVGEMLTQTQNDYLNYVYKDYFTIEEYMLLGDPSLRVGGYP